MALSIQIGQRVELLPHPQMWPKEMDGLQGHVTGYKIINNTPCYVVKIDCLARELHCIQEIVGVV